MGKTGQITVEAYDLLKEIIDNENNGIYWKERFENLSIKEDIILRGCFKELKDNGLINVQWADNIPYYIQILKEGYLYEQHKQQERLVGMSTFEKELNELLERTNNIKPPINSAPIGVSIDDYNRDSEIWMNDAEIFYNKYLKNHALASRIQTQLFLREYKKLVACMQSISKDQGFIDEINDIEKVSIPPHEVKGLPEYDVFISHANKDKEDLVEELYRSLKKLGIEIFYDKESLEWGDKWKDRILDGTRKSEFAIIVISEFFFDREWTEKELYEFLNRQNRNGQKLILPILHNITPDQLREKYNSLADIQAISSNDYTCDQIALMFANQLIKRLKMTN